MADERRPTALLAQLKALWDRTNGGGNGQGSKGDKGDTGDRGEQGQPGADGQDGAPGVQGAPGNDGQQGVKGDTGDTGSQGLQGGAGADGPAGAPGPAGEPGDAGETGPQGDAGPQGEQGIAGNTGPAGADSQVPGPQGEQGLTGGTGSTGPQGPAGDDGAQGPQGDPGIQGAPGNDGAAGQTGSQGPQGNAGGQGIQGIQGEIGPQGPQGNPGAGVAPTLYKLIAAHANSTITPSTIGNAGGNTPWTHTLVVGKSYRFTILGTHQTVALTTGGRMNLLGAGGLAGSVLGMMWGAIAQATAASTLEAAIYSFANGVGSFLLTTAVAPINAPHIWGADFVFHCTTGGTLSLQWASEVASSAAQLNIGSSLIVELLN